jgi:hypothetical protein
MGSEERKKKKKSRIRPRSRRNAFVTFIVDAVVNEHRVASVSDVYGGLDAGVLFADADADRACTGGRQQQHGHEQHHKHGDDRERKGKNSTRHQ